MKKYQKVRTVGHREIAQLLMGPVQIQEKIDGSNFAFGKTIAGELFCTSRNRDLSLTDTTGMFKSAVDYIISIGPLVTPGFIFRAEFLSKPKHNVLAYEKTPQNHLVLFEVDHLNANGETTPACFDAAELSIIAERYDIACTRTFFVGDILPEVLREMFACWEKVPSILGGQIEGIVIKNWNRYTPDGCPQIGKIVREEFKEVHRHIIKGERAEGHKKTIQGIGEALGGPARWQKAVQHLTELGVIVNGPEDIGPLMKRVQVDIIEECEQEIKQALYVKFQKDVRAGACHGLVDWYKEKIGV